LPGGKKEKRRRIAALQKALSIWRPAIRLLGGASDALNTFTHRPNKEPPMKFAFLGYSREQYWDAMSKPEQNAMIEDCFTYDSKLLKDGHLIGDGAALQPSRTAKTLRWHNGAVVVTDGPFAETKELLGGIGVLEARDMAHAVELMAKHPGLRYGATFEIRPIDEEALKRHANSLAAICNRAADVASPALKFAALGYINENGRGSMSKDEWEAMFQKCIAFDEARIQSGQWQHGIALQSTRSARTLRAKAGQVIITDGPYAETKEQLGGIVVLAFRDWDDAVATLSKHPALPFGVVMELRPLDAEINEHWKAYR